MKTSILSSDRPRMMKCVAWTLAWIAIVVLGAFLRLDDLGSRPFHADEASGARITALRMDDSIVNFDPKHFHGPLLADLAIPLFHFRGESGWLEMTKETPRLLTALAGIFLLILPLAGVRRFGHAPMLLASACLASSPLLVYYSRMFIHEPLLVFFGLAAWFSLAHGSRYGLVGLLIGLMFAVKETFVISVLSWTLAAAVLIACERHRLTRENIREWSRQYAIHWICAILLFFATWIWFYSDGLRHPRGLIDSILTFFVYETTAGHNKAAAYYLQLLAWPVKAAGKWWFGTPIVIMGAAAIWISIRNSSLAPRTRRCVHFLAISTLFQFLIYSIIQYKTPWLACLPWAQLCLLSGFSIHWIFQSPPAIRAVLGILIGATLYTQFSQSRLASGRMASDPRNPFAYVPTQRNIERLDEWLGRLKSALPDDALAPTWVIGQDYWPLPWYLRRLEQVGWSSELLPTDLTAAPLVFAMPEMAAALNTQLEETHIAWPRGLRAEVPVMMYLRKDLYDAWMNSDS
ncbi:MAG: flippase activity-associated protein Agl23 [Luteolibacter sp.]